MSEITLAVAKQVMDGLRKHVSIDQWPVLSLHPGQFSHCACGKRRVDHPFNSTDRDGIKCEFFVAAHFAKGD